jgi:PAS domain S-box-containing protein
LTTALPRAAMLGRSAEWERLREEKAVLEQIVQSAAGGIVLLDADSRVRLWNPAMERIRGVPAEEALGRRYDDLLAGPDASGARATLDRLLAGVGPDSPYPSVEVKITTSEGIEHWLCCDHSLRFEGGRWTADVVTVHDVTRLREVERAKADFVATVSHELRTPITPIKGYVELLRAKGDSMPEELRQDVLRTVAERTNHMARLIEDLLLASRISSEGPGAVVLGLQLELTDLVEVTRRTAADYLREPTRRLKVELPAEPLEISADPLRLSQILANLLSNAHKYSPPDAPIHLRLWRDGVWARASVADRGAGIPSEELERIFDKFHRVEDPMTMTAGGTGLGLYIARELARAMGGEVEADSVRERGSTFTVRLPLARQAVTAASPSPLSGAPHE